VKSLYIVRHAKAESPFGINDFERPLAERGKKDAADMARRLLAKKITIDAFVSSPAKRAKKTAAIFNNEYGRKEDEVLLISSLYHATNENFYDAVTGLDDSLNSVAIFSHNPGITYFAASLTTIRIDNMPTCAVFAVQADISNWKNFVKAKKEFLFFDWPKNI
jgi:phosphohistidine phosphatase